MNSVARPIDRIEKFVSEMFPGSCSVAVEGFDHTVEKLSVEEARVVANASPGRRREFAAGRAAAKRALARLGIYCPGIPAGRDRAPQWPPNVVGSISHAHGVAIAVVSRSAEVLGLGIDVERTGAVSGEVVPLLLTGSEQQWLRVQATKGAEAWATMLFSAKEAFFKFQYPATKAWIDFRDVEVSIRSETEFDIRILGALRIHQRATFRGRFLLSCDGLTITAIHA
ncbi:MAG TPA: 4'-phosphopantetheinyl transferase superfamily protein [Opitutaceae bacterium]|nr:4'-phosphopantetheinyl transferase superfamily protein [Opitutaceae bacterium]